MFCSGCGKRITDVGKKCPACGVVTEPLRSFKSLDINTASAGVHSEYSKQPVQHTVAPMYRRTVSTPKKADTDKILYAALGAAAVFFITTIIFIVAFGSANANVKKLESENVRLESRIVEETADADHKKPEKDNDENGLSEKINRTDATPKPDKEERVTPAPNDDEEEEEKKPTPSPTPKATATPSPTPKVTDKPETKSPENPGGAISGIIDEIFGLVEVEGDEYSLNLDGTEEFEINGKSETVSKIYFSKKDYPEAEDKKEFSVSGKLSKDSDGKIRIVPN